MKIENAEKIFKFEFVHQLNKPMSIKVWADTPIDNLLINDKKMSAKKHEAIDKRIATYLSSNCDYKSQLKGELIDFVCLGFSFVPNYIVHDDHVELLRDIGAQYQIAQSNITKIQYKENMYKELRIEFEPQWEYLYAGFNQERHTIKTYNQKKLEKILPVENADYKKIRILRRKIEPAATSQYSVFNNRLYKTIDCNIEIDYQYFCNVLRSESICINVASDATKKLSKPIEYKFKIPHKPGLQQWQANVKYLKFDIVWHNNASYKARRDNCAEEFDDTSWEKINKKQYLSFNYDPSFFNTEHGARCFEKMKIAMPFIIDENLGDCITVTIVNAQGPQLNDWFEFRGKKFRVVKYSVHKGTFDFVEIVGREMLKCDVDFSRVDLKTIRWEEEDNMPASFAEFFSADEDMRYEHKEGMVIITPEDTAIASRIVLDTIANAA